MENSKRTTEITKEQDLTMFEYGNISLEKQHEAINYLLNSDCFTWWQNKLWDFASQFSTELEGFGFSNHVHTVRVLYRFFDILKAAAIDIINKKVDIQNLSMFDEYSISQEKQYEAIKHIENSDAIQYWPDRIWSLLYNLDKSVSSEEYSDFIYTTRHLHKFFEILLEGLSNDQPINKNELEIIEKDRANKTAIKTILEIAQSELEDDEKIRRIAIKTSNQNATLNVLN